MVRQVNGSWTAPKSIYNDNWQINGCPVNGPRADAIGNNLAIAWFAINKNEAEVKIIFSEDGGESFHDPVRIDEGKPIGRVAVRMLNNTTALVAWMEGSEIKAVKVNAGGKRGKSVVVAASSESRSSGFPQMTIAGNKIIFAWTDDKLKKVRVSEIEL